MKGLSVIVTSKQEFEKIRELLTPEYCYLNWHDDLLSIPTAVVIWAKKKTNLSTGVIGCAESQADYGLRVVEFKDYFKI